MDKDAIDFGNAEIVAQNQVETNQQTTEEVDDINGEKEVEDLTGKDGSTTSNQPNPVDDNKDVKDDNSSTGDLVTGDKVEFEGVTYTVAENGDLVDDKGNVFKEAKDVNDWIKSLDIDDSNDTELSIESIQNVVGITVTDENGKNIEFDNTPEGVKAYINSVIDIRANELQESAINRLYSENPLLKQFQDYVTLTGTPRGFGDLPDRSGIVVEKDNEMQQIAIIRMAAKEFGNTVLNDNYLKYLRDNGGLYEEANIQLKNLVQKDEQIRKDIELKAKEAREAEEENSKQYWDSVKNAVDKRVVAGYKIPESFTKNVNGTKVTCTPNDFYKYISQPIKQKDGSYCTNYQQDLNNLSDEDYLNRDIIDAWLMFTGGTYKDLVDMAVKEDKVRQLRVRSKEPRSNGTVKITKSNKTKASINDIIF